MIIPNRSSSSSINSIHIPQIDRQSIIVESTLGSGCFATVFKVRVSPCATGLSSSSCSSSYALKRISEKTMSNDKPEEETLQAVIDLKTEATLLSRIPQHENIVQLFGVSTSLTLSSCEDDRGDDCFILLELLHQDTLKDRIERLRRKESLRSMLFNGVGCSSAFLSSSSLETNYDAVMDRIQTIGVGIAKGMEHIHNCNVILRDLKPDNVGFCIKTGAPKIFDFGFARDLDTIQNKKEIAGTLRYMAPELAHCGIASKASDVHSFGILLWELCTLQVAFHKFSKKQFVQDVVKGGLRPSVQQCIPSKSLGTLMKECWHVNPERRPTFAAVVDTLESEVTMSQHLQKQQRLSQLAKKSSSSWTTTSISSSSVPSMLGSWKNSLFATTTASVAPLQ